MLYELKRGRVEFITFTELSDDYVMYDVPKSTLFECNENQYNFRNNTYVSDKLVFVVLDIINFSNVFGDKNRLALYVRNDMVLIVSVKDSDNSIKKTFEAVVSYYDNEEHVVKGRGDKRYINTFPEKFLYHFLDILIVNDRRLLENMEHNMSLLEDDILNEAINTNFINEILSIKKELMYIWNYYDQLADVGEILYDNETDMFPDNNIRGFDVFSKRVQRLMENVKQLKEYAVQLQETQDAILSYSLNNIMKLFTVVTAIFLPLSLIVGWYGMNFSNMPELSWKYGYLSVVILSVMIVVLCMVFFKRKGLI